MATSLAVTKGGIKGMAHRIMSLQNRVKKATEASVHVLSGVVQTTEISGAAFAFGVAQGKVGGIEIGGLPIDLLAGAAGNVLALAGVGGKMAPHLKNFADGALACYAANQGRIAGKAWADKK